MPVDPHAVQELFLKLVELAPAERLPALAQESAIDVEVRIRVAALLQAHDEANSYLDGSTGALEPTVIGDRAADAPTHAELPDVVPAAECQMSTEDERLIAGRYALQQKIGEGGMGEVWVARQTEPVRRKVALKLIKSGMDSRAVLARFEQERQALAMMDHPHIARVLDGGVTPSGQPFFVMELVNGLPLTRFCDEAMLTPRQRLELFVPICHAVQHAHQKGIVHRDLKPANILVTLVDGRPVPKVIDFGVAKAVGGKLTDETLSTQFGAIVGTLEYMSPEQAGFSNVDVDTRADIYSLGVILYEMLTGLRPLDARRLKKGAVMEMIRIIQEVEPSKPSTRLSTDESLPSLAALRQTDPRKLMALLRGELDWVVMKCLEKSRDRRYETANALSRDIEHYLADEPVEARPPTTGYRLSKFLKRNRTTVMAAALVLLALVGGIIGTTLGMMRAIQAERLAEDRFVQAELERKRAAELATAEAEQRRIADRRREEADQERDRADRNFRTARDAVDRMLTRVADELRGQPQTERVRRALLNDALKFYQEFLKEKSGDPAIRFETGKAMLRVGNVYCFLGQVSAGISEYREAIATFAQLLQAEPRNAEYREQLAEGHHRLARALIELYEFDPAIAELNNTIELWEGLSKDWPDRPLYLQNQAQANWEIGMNLRGRYWFAKAIPYLQRKQSLLEEISKRFPDFPIDARLKEGRMAVVPADQVSPEQAAAPQGRDYGWLPHDPAVLKQYEGELNASVSYWEQQFAAHPDAPVYQRTFLQACGQLMKILLAQQRMDDLQRLADRTEGQMDQLAARYPDSVEYQVSAAWDNFLRGDLKYEAGKHDEARELFRRAIQTAKTIADRFPKEKRHHTHLLGMLLYCPDPEVRDAQRAVHEAQAATELNTADGEWGELAYALSRNGQQVEALQALEKARAKTPNEPRLDLVEAFIRLEQREFDEARRLYAKGTEVLDRTPNRFWYTLQMRAVRREFERRLVH